MQVNKLTNFGIAVASHIVGVAAVTIARADHQRLTEANIEYAKGIAQPHMLRHACGYAPANRGSAKRKGPYRSRQGQSGWKPPSEGRETALGVAQWTRGSIMSRFYCGGGK
jgi:hypothetical protein